LSEGTYSSINVPGATYTEAWKRDDHTGKILGRYKDTNGHSHIYVRSRSGEFNTIDFPGAVETAFGNFSDKGGMNSRGDIVSNYCDAAPCPQVASEAKGNVHGFLLTRSGRFSRFDAPNSMGTAAYGINDYRKVVGTYLDTIGRFHGFVYQIAVEADKEDAGEVENDSALDRIQRIPAHRAACR
jgi:hypothetical protein